MRAVYVIALNTFRESARDRLAFAALLATLAFMATGPWLIELSVSNWQKILTEVGLATANAGGLALVVLVGSGVLAREFQRRTTFLLFARPVTAWQVVLGKYLGFLATLATGLALMVALLLTTNVAIAAASGDPVPATFTALFHMALELAILSAIALAASMALPPAASALTVITFYAVGHAIAPLREASTSPAMRALLNLAPDLERFNDKSRVITATPLDPTVYLADAGLAALAIALALATATFLLIRRELS